MGRLVAVLQLAIGEVSLLVVVDSQPGATTSVTGSPEDAFFINFELSVALAVQHLLTRCNRKHSFITRTKYCTV